VNAILVREIPLLSSARRCPPRRPGLPLAGIACFFLALGAASNALAAGRVVYVNGSSGNDANDCLAASRACRTIQRGANVVRGGDRMVVSAGVYYETPTFTNLGSSAASPVWILSEIPGGATISGMWKEAALGQVSWRDDGGGVFSAPHGPALLARTTGCTCFVSCR
jgi:hypothetical protein